MPRVMTVIITTTDPENVKKVLATARYMPDPTFGTAIVDAYERAKMDESEWADAVEAACARIDKLEAHVPEWLP